MLPKTWNAMDQVFSLQEKSKLFRSLQTPHNITRSSSEDEGRRKENNLEFIGLKQLKLCSPQRCLAIICDGMRRVASFYKDEHNYFVAASFLSRPLESDIDLAD